MKKVAANAGIEVSAVPDLVRPGQKCAAYIDRQIARGKIRHSQTFTTATEGELKIRK